VVSSWPHPSGSISHHYLFSVAQVLHGVGKLLISTEHCITFLCHDIENLFTYLAEILGDIPSAVETDSAIMQVDLKELMTFTLTPVTISIG